MCIVKIWLNCTLSSAWLGLAACVSHFTEVVALLWLLMHRNLSLQAAVIGYQHKLDGYCLVSAGLALGC